MASTPERLSAKGAVLLGAALLLVAGLASCRTPGVKLHRNPPLVFGAVPAQTVEERRRDLQPVVDYLEERLDAPITFEVPASYNETSKALNQQRWDLAYVGPILYSRAHETGYDAAVVPVRGGKTTIRGLVVARADRGLKSLAELRGKSLAFVDPSSSTGFQYPFALLFANGLKPQDYQRTFLKSHRNVIREVFAGRFDAGATYEGAAEEVLSTSEREQLVVLGETDPVPSDVFATRRGSPRAAEIREALLALSAESSCARLLKGMRAEKLQPADEAAYDSARRIDLLVTEESGL